MSDTGAVTNLNHTSDIQILIPNTQISGYLAETSAAQLNISSNLPAISSPHSFKQSAASNLDIPNQITDGHNSAKMSDIPRHHLESDMPAQGVNGANLVAGGSVQKA